ncbi:PIN domain-containing protein [Aquibium carbonis]|uniref:PIN domain-containing protein n=1 Tax=Aquibium carbonis TaxID=2495581 RepID=A0A429YZF9_9HYPH|nr:PIN domain-containing protein [Aquibium carbonis]RST86830.1 PIN domain-containing protein [Aquibium carbonis]
MEIKRLYLDANILILLGEGKDERASLLTELAVGQETSSTPFLCTSELTLAELLVKPYREQDDRLIQQYESWMTPGGFMEIGPVHSSALRYAAVLRSQYGSIKLPDAIHLSTAIGFGCSHFLSGDTRIPDRIELFHTRWGLTRGPSILDVLRPDPDVLRTITRSEPQID